MPQRIRQLTIAFAVLATLVTTTESSAQAAIDTSAYVPVGPIRLADTRETPCGCERASGNTIVVDVAERVAGFTSGDVVAAAVTVTALSTSAVGFVTVFPNGTDRPDTSTVNTRTDRTVANSTIVPVGSDGSIALFSLVPGDVVVDVTGVFVGAETARAGRFVPTGPERLTDTRVAPEAALGPNGEITVPLPAGVPADATALAINVTTVDDPRPSFLSVRPAGERAQATSFLNSMGTGRAIAAAVIAPVSPDGLTIRSRAGGHVIVDFTGWFTGDSADESDVGLFRPRQPERLIDTRTLPTRLHAAGAIEVTNPVPGAAALATNVTVTAPDRRGFVAAFPAGTARPRTSTVNPTFWNHTVANFAISPVSDRGIAYWALAPTDLVVDVTGSFVGEPIAASRAPLPNQPTTSRVLMVGDSTLKGIDIYPDSQVAFRDFVPVIDAGPCRRLLRPSCLSNTTGMIPSTAVEAIQATPGTVDIVVIKTGYNDWFSDFPLEFGAVVDASRAKGAHTILWLTYNEDVSRDTPRRAYEENNADLRWLTRLPQYDDVEIADWLTYSTPRSGEWFWDGIHVGRSGAFATSDYIARWVAALEHRPCPAPWVAGAAIPKPCPPPEVIGPVPDPIGLWS